MAGGGVSILTRPEGRVLPARTAAWRTRKTFQSSPGPKAGCYILTSGRAVAIFKVSILTRPEGRVLRENVALTREAYVPSFNPHPARRPGATR